MVRIRERRRRSLNLRSVSSDYPMRIVTLRAEIFSFRTTGWIRNEGQRFYYLGACVKAFKKDSCTVYETESVRRTKCGMTP